MLNIFSTSAFVLYVSSLVTAQNNTFIYPPPLDSGIVLPVGQVVTLQWKTNYSEITLLAWQGPDNNNNYHSSTLLCTHVPVQGQLEAARLTAVANIKASADHLIPTSFQWTVNYVLTAVPADAPIHFSIHSRDGSDINSGNILIKAAGNPSSSAALTPSSTPSGSSSNNNTTKVGLGVGVGLGVPLLLILGGLAGYWLHRRNSKRKTSQGVDPAARPFQSDEMKPSQHGVEMDGRNPYELETTPKQQESYGCTRNEVP